MALLAETPALDLYDPEWVIHTRSEERPAALLGPEARVEGNLLCDGCRVEGTVIRSIISPGVYVAPGRVGARLDRHDRPVIEAGAEVDRAILDKRVMVGAGRRSGLGRRQHAQQQVARTAQHGLTLVGKEAMVPGGHDDRAQRGESSRRYCEGLSRPRSGERRDDRRITPIKWSLVFDII